MTMPVAPTVAPTVPRATAGTIAAAVPAASPRTAAPGGALAAARNAGASGTVPVFGAGTSLTTGPRTRVVPGAEARACPAPAVGAVLVLLSPDRPLPGLRGEVMIACTAVSESGAGSAGRLGRWVRGALRRGHRPIIARTRGALCSPRHNSR
ncbi:hypothetical protein GCM10010384_40740 [Streptomyces djakartensis]|uniref:Uncharacterized protein n=1 Tax=Streptomyces djakartensis TaxID=68193 RepID=A0ABQ2ZYK0_9ACTN|nr:hypothetical protein GCM10010384_40740 [Streptomyces djakartensis]